MATDKNISVLDEILARITPAEKNRSRRRMRLAATIDDILKEKKISKVQFAKAMGKEPSVITKWLSGTHNMTMDTLSDICDFLEVPMSKLVEEKHKRVSYTTQWHTQVRSTDLPHLPIGKLASYIHAQYYGGPCLHIEPQFSFEELFSDNMKELKGVIKSYCQAYQKHSNDHFMTLGTDQLIIKSTSDLKATKSK